MYAIVESGGRQVLVKPGGVVSVDRRPEAAGEQITLDRVLLVATDDGTVVVGAPHVAGTRVNGVVDGDAKADKIRVFLKKRRKGMRRTIGHRTRLTRIRVTRIDTPTGV